MSDPEAPTPPVPPPRRPIAPAGQPTEPLARAVPRQPVVERVPLEPPAYGPRDSSPWPAVLAGTLALIVGALVGYLIGHNDRTTTETRAGAAVTHSVTTTVPKVEVRTVTSKTVTQTAAPPNAAAEERARTTEERLRKAEAENERLQQQLGEAGG